PSYAVVRHERSGIRVTASRSTPLRDRYTRGGSLVARYCSLSLKKEAAGHEQTLARTDGLRGIRSARLTLFGELDLLRDYFGEHGKPVLNTQALDLAVLQFPAVLNQSAPRRREFMRAACGLVLQVSEVARGQAPFSMLEYYVV